MHSRQISTKRFLVIETLSERKKALVWRQHVPCSICKSFWYNKILTYFYHIMWWCRIVSWLRIQFCIMQIYHQTGISPSGFIAIRIYRQWRRNSLRPSNLFEENSTPRLPNISIPHSSQHNLISVNDPTVSNQRQWSGRDLTTCIAIHTRKPPTADETLPVRPRNVHHQTSPVPIISYGCL